MIIVLRTTTQINIKLTIDRNEFNSLVINEH